MIERIKTRARDFEQCGEIASVLIKEKRAKRFSTLDFINQIRAVVVRGTSLYPSLPYFCSAKIRDRSAK